MQLKKLISYICFLSFIFVKVNFAADTLTVMTYNIQGMKPGTDPATRILKIIEKLKIFNPDIIGLQEINEFLNGTKNQGKQIADSLSVYFNIPYYFYQQATHLSWDNKFRESIGIISKYPVLKSGFKQLVNGIFPRKAVWNYIDTPVGMVNMFNTHLSYNSGSVRNQQVLQIIDYVKEIENQNPGVATILTGDFNDAPAATSVRYLTETNSDTFYISTFTEANPGKSGATVPASSPSSKIDYVFYKNIGQLEVLKSLVIMGSPYDGVYYCSDHRAVLTEFTGNVTDVALMEYDEIPKKIKLYQNYPNPFNPSTTIKYSLQDPQVVSLIVYNMLGSKIATLVSAYQHAGSYTVEFDGSNLSSGVYMYKLQVGENFKIRKMILSK